MGEELRACEDLFPHGHVESMDLAKLAFLLFEIDVRVVVVREWLEGVWLNGASNWAAVGRGYDGGAL